LLFQLTFIKLTSNKKGLFFIKKKYFERANSPENINMNLNEIEKHNQDFFLLQMASYCDPSVQTAFTSLGSSKES